MSAEERRIEKLTIEATGLVEKINDCRQKITQHIAVLKATAGLILAKGGKVPQSVTDELKASEAE